MASNPPKLEAPLTRTANGRVAYANEEDRKQARRDANVRYRAQHKDRIAAELKAKRAADPELLERRRETARRYTNSAKGQAQAQQWQQENREYLVQKRKDYYARVDRPRNTQMRAADPEAAREQDRLARVRGGEGLRRSQRKWQKEWRKKNPEEARQRYLRARAKPDFTEKGSARTRAWRAKNPEAKKRQARIDALRRAPGRDQNTVLYVDILTRDPCAYCGNETEHIDHIVAVSRGGTSCWDNLTAACRACNQQKLTQSLLRFLASR